MSKLTEVKMVSLKDKINSIEIVPALEKVEKEPAPKPKRFRKPLKVGTIKKGKKK